jgi:hypothetical protein
MYDTAIAVAGILGVSLILAVLVHASARLRIEQQRTLQKLLDSGGSIDSLATVDGFGHRAGRDLRRGILLAAIGAAWSLVTFFIGGQAWILGAVPVAVGLAYVLFWKLDGMSR